MNDERNEVKNKQTVGIRRKRRVRLFCLNTTRMNPIQWKQLAIATGNPVIQYSYYHWSCNQYTGWGWTRITYSGNMQSLTVTKKTTSNANGSLLFNSFSHCLFTFVFYFHDV